MYIILSIITLCYELTANQEREVSLVHTTFWANGHTRVQTSITHRESARGGRGSPNLKYCSTCKRKKEPRDIILHLVTLNII